MTRRAHTPFASGSIPLNSLILLTQQICPRSTSLNKLQYKSTSSLNTDLKDNIFKKIIIQESWNKPILPRDLTSFKKIKLKRAQLYLLKSYNHNFNGYLNLQTRAVVKLNNFTRFSSYKTLTVLPLNISIIQILWNLDSLKWVWSIYFYEYFANLQRSSLYYILIATTLLKSNILLTTTLINNRNKPTVFNQNQLFLLRNL